MIVNKIFGVFAFCWSILWYIALFIMFLYTYFLFYCDIYCLVGYFGHVYRVVYCWFKGRYRKCKWNSLHPYCPCPMKRLPKSVLTNEKSMSHCYGNIHLMLCEIRIKSSSQILKADIAKSTFTQWISKIRIPLFQNLTWPRLIYLSSGFKAGLTMSECIYFECVALPCICHAYAMHRLGKPALVS